MGSPLPLYAKQILVQKTIAMVMVCTKLHNFCLNQGQNQVLLHSPDEAYATSLGVVSLVNVLEAGTQGIPQDLLGGGDHFDDVTIAGRRCLVRVHRENEEDTLPWTKMLQMIEVSGVSRPSLKVS